MCRQVWSERRRYHPDLPEGGRDDGQREIDRVITILTYPSPSRMVVSDTGMGISPELEESLFSPFFSTKRDGQGLGLTIIREILLNHGFLFSLKTVTPGVTEFSILFE